MCCSPIKADANATHPSTTVLAVQVRYVEDVTLSQRVERELALFKVSPYRT